MGKALLLPISTLALLLGSPSNLTAQSPPPGVPATAKHFDGHWFEAVNFADLTGVEERLSWNDAQELAQRRGGNLASINTNEKREFVRSMLLPWPESDFWMGIFFDGSEWWCVNGEPYKRDKPDDRNMLRRLYIASLKHRREIGGRFDDDPLRGAIIEYTPGAAAPKLPPPHWSSPEFKITEAARPPGIPETAVHFNGHWYEVLTHQEDDPELEGKPWDKAHDYCVEKGGHLACLNTADERLFVLHLLKDYTKENFWIGGYRARSSWRWIDGTQLTRDGAPVGTGRETTRRVAIMADGQKRFFTGDRNLHDQTHGLVIEYTPGETVEFSLPQDSSAPPPSSTSSSNSAPSFSNAATTGSEFAKPIELKANQAKVNGLLVMDTGAGEAGSASTMSMIALPDDPSKPAMLQFNQEVGPSMQTALGEVVKFIELQHDGWPRGRKMEISFENKYNPKDGPSAAVACALLLESLIIGEALDPGFAVTGDMNADGSVQPIGGVEAKIRGATKDDCTHIAIPKNNITALYDTVLMDGIAPIMKIQAFSIATFEEALALARSEKPLSVEVALNEFSAIQDLYRKNPSGFAQTIRHPQVVEKLTKVIEASPNHISASLLLAYATGQGPKSLSLHGSFSFIDENAYQIVGVIKDGEVDELGDFEQDQVADAVALLRRNKLKLDKRTWHWADSLMRWGEQMREYQTNRPKAINNLNKLIDSINAAGREAREQREQLLEDPEIMEELLE
ncbi:MAG: hypothetical protein HRU46_02970 [Verrucomicrobiales bacterium]|nr:hypothetical protein [Verrucomicrobiales bacterium]